MKNLTLISILLLLLSTTVFAQKNGGKSNQLEILNDSTFTQVEELPSFEGGMTAFYEYVQKNMLYPEEARKNKVEGKVFIEFVVTKSGKIESTQVLRGIGAGCDVEAARVIKNSPKWTPGKQRGKAVNVKMVLPITFKLGKE